MAHGRGAVALLALAVVCAVGVAQVGAQRAPAPAPGSTCAVHNPCFNFTRTTEPPNYNTGVGFLYYDKLCTLVDAGTSFCLDPGSGCRRCKTQYAAEVVDVSYPICPRCVCNEFPNAFGCEGQALPPFNGPPAPDCAANAVCFANADVNEKTGLGYEFLDSRCDNRSSLTGCTGTDSCRSCKAPSAPASVDLPVCPPCVCRSYYTANACLGPNGEDYYGLGPFPFSAPAPRPSSGPSPTPAPAPSPSQVIPPGAIAKCLRTSTPNVDLGVTYQFFSFDCFNTSSKVGCTAVAGCKLCRLEYVGTASRGSRRLLQAAAPAPGVDQPICPSYVCDYAPFNLVSAQCLPGGSPSPAPGVNETFVSITAAFTLIGPNGTLVPFNSTRQQAFINSVADALLISTDSIVINNYTEATNSTTDVVTLVFTVSTSTENATLLQQQINALTAGNSDFVLLLNGNGLGVEDVVLQTPASLVTPTAELLSGSYTVCGPTGSLIPFNSTKQTQFEEGLATFINLPGDYQVTPQNVTVANYTERPGNPTECVDVGFTVSVFSTYVNEVAAQLDSIGDSNGISDRNLIGILNGAGLGVTTVSQLGSVIPFSPAPAPGPASNGSDNGGGLSGGAIAGIVIGSVVGVLLLLLLLCLCLRRRKRASQQGNVGGASYAPAAKGPQYPSVDVEVLPSGGTTASGPSRGAPR